MKFTRIGALIAFLVVVASPAAAQSQEALPVEIEVYGPGPEARLDAARVALVDLINSREDLTYGSGAPNPVRLVFRFTCVGDNPPLRDPDGTYRTACHARLAVVRALSAADARRFDGAEVVFTERAMWVTVLTELASIQAAGGRPGDVPEIPYERIQNDSIADVLGDVVGELASRMDAATFTALASER